jgi:hypothetical protein
MLERLKQAAAWSTGHPCMHGSHVTSRPHVPSYPTTTTPRPPPALARSVWGPGGGEARPAARYPKVDMAVTRRTSHTLPKDGRRRTRVKPHSAHVAHAAKFKAIKRTGSKE